MEGGKEGFKVIYTSRTITTAPFTAFGLAYPLQLIYQFLRPRLQLFEPESFKISREIGAILRNSQALVCSGIDGCLRRRAMTNLVVERMSSPSKRSAIAKLGDQMRPFLKGIVDSLSIGIGYVSIAFSFGVVTVESGLSPVQAMLISSVVFAGASQFILVALIVADSSAWAAVLAVLLMNIRHVFYGPSVMSELSMSGRTVPTPLLAFGLTDEVFATVVGKIAHLDPDGRDRWLLGIEIGAYVAWLAGTLLGALIGQSVLNQSILLKESLGFVLPALFCALLIEIYRDEQKPTIVTALIVTLGTSFFAPIHVAMLLGMVGGALGGAWYGGRTHAA